MGFLNDLAEQISSQYSLGENTNTSLDAVIDGNDVKYGALGEFASKFDQSAERKYVEEGYLRKDAYNTAPKQFEVLMQQPNATLLVKKRMFSSIAENFDPQFMDNDEKLYLRCIKILFQNKCNQISTLEKLSKIQKITSLVGEIDNYMIPLILNLTDSLSKDFTGDPAGTNEFGVPIQSESDSLVKVVDRLRRIYSYNITNPYTSWVVDNTNLMKSQYGEGTGVIEITNFNQIDTNVSIDMTQNGSCNFTIQDPYQAMLITDYDIERAIADGTNLFYNSKTYQMGKESSETLINELQTRLNQYRSERGASPLTFKVNPDTLLGKRVRAIIERQGIDIPFTYNAGEAIKSSLNFNFNEKPSFGVEVPPEYLKGGEIAGLDGLDTIKKKYGGKSSINDNFNISRNTHVGLDSELSLFSRLIKTIFDRLMLIANSVNAFQTANKETNYVRRKLRFNFMGKLIIQPSDVVHIYMSSKSKFDNRLLGGLSNMFNGLGFLQKATQTLTDLKNSFDTVFNPKANVDLQVEKAAFVGSGFPTYLWNMVRSQFINENEGVHVFGGIIDSATDSWNRGNFTVSVRCNDNSEYFNRGKINFKPGADVFNGRLFNPLTPFKSNFDTINSNAKFQTPEFLEENKWLLSEAGTGYSPLSKYKHGPSFGLPLTEKSLFQDKSIDPLSGLLTKTIHAPDGLVYKWKEGIGVMVQAGNFSDFNDPSRVGFQTQYKDPFAGQDVMNVLSLLITGVPYNFATYWKAIGSPNYSKDNTGNKSAADNYYESLRSTLSKNNLLWGNFIPFKNLVLDEATYNNKMQAQITATKRNTILNSKLEKLRDLYNQMKQHNIIALLSSTTFFQSYGRANDTASPLVQLQSQVKILENEINVLIIGSRRDHETLYAQGNEENFDISTDYDPNIGSKNNPAATAIIRRRLRRELNYLTRRMSYNVRANDDKNLFIVDDFYDKDYDIIAYNQEPESNMKIFNNAFSQVKENITSTAKLLNLEIFCDTQGHVRVRPPQYNRVPSSVFYKMMYMKDVLGVQVFPQFLSDLFGTQLDSLKLQIEIIEDYIRFYCSLVGYDNDFTATEYFIKSYSIDSKKGANTTFGFISSSDGSIVNLNDIIINANPDLQESNQGLDTFNFIEMQSKNNQNLFSTADRAQVLVEALTKKKLAYAGYSIDETDKILSNKRTQILADRIFDKSGQKINIKNYMTNVTQTLGGDVNNYDYSIDLFKVIKELSDKIGERQKAVKLFYSNIKNYSEYRSLDDNTSIANKLLAPGNYSNSNIPEVFEHMIEDETYDDLGPGSGQRYIIKSAQIKSVSFTETAPSQTYVEVQGTLSSYLDPGKLPANLNNFPLGGNAMTTAGAIDYDMWRNYGFKDSVKVTVPFLKDPITQCAPFATMLLSRARKEVLKGTLTISGNEYMQPGEVVFLEDRGLLFYVASVKHNFSFGKQFETTLELTYGHAPGEYIPTTLDVMGKMLYNNRDLCNINIYRQSSAANNNHLGVIRRGKYSKVAINNSTTTEATNNPYDADNLRTINNILYSVQQFINKTTSDSMKPDKITRVELRTYRDNSVTEPDEELEEFVDIVKKTLLGKNDFGANASYNPSIKAQTPWINNEKAVEIVDVNLSDEEDFRSPSQKAISMARDLLEEQNVALNPEKNNNQNNRLRENLFKYIVDCWIVYEDVPAIDTVGSKA